MEIDLAYLDEDNLLSTNYQEIYENIIREACNHLQLVDDLELSCIIVDDHKIHEINKEYRNIDRSTDVISFALEDNEQFYCPGQPRCLGDIFISNEHAISQSKEYNHTLDREMCFLFTHGLLHLLGYDHMEEKEEQEMIALQKIILDKVGMERV